MSQLFRKIDFWDACFEQGVLPWKVPVQSIEELEQLRAEGAEEIQRTLIARLKQRHGQNVGIESPISRANIRAGIITEITQEIGRRFGTTYTVFYTRAGETEFLGVDADGLRSWYFSRMVETLTLRQQMTLRLVL